MMTPHSREGPDRLPRLPDWARLPLIGACIRITRSTDPSLVGLEGIVISETQRTLEILTPEGKTKKVLKRVVWFRPCSHDEEIAGMRLERRPEDRIRING